MKVLVTGGAGFIGHHLVRALVARGDDVVVLDDLSTGRLERLAAAPTVRIVQADLRDGAAVTEAVRDCDVIFHQAALASVVGSVADPVEANAVNVDGTVRLMVEAARARVRRVIVASSSAVYGDDPQLPSRETDRAEPASPYATSKLAAEGYLHTIGATTGVETVALRYFNVYGPGQDPDAEYAAVVPRFIQAGLAGRQPVIYGNGQQTRDFIFVEDVVRANLCAADTPGLTGLTANVGSGTRASLLDLLDAVGTAVGRAFEPRFETDRPGDVRDSQADPQLAADRFGFRAQVALGDGIGRTTAWYRATADSAG